MSDSLLYAADEEAVVRRIKAQDAALTEPLDQHGAPAPPLTDPVEVTAHGERFTVPLTAAAPRRTPEPVAAEFDQELASAPPHIAGPLLRRASEALPGDVLDRVDVLITAERQAGTGTAAT
ncbi:hypothetical protein [Streptomyces buecherae]|uniref:hypothetical protein n=1 Tax=Streptomyces buecherae TaxID=2763006 RepID=UPI0037974926